MTAEISTLRASAGDAAVTPAPPPLPTWPAHWPRPETPDPATIEATRAWLRREIDTGQNAAGTALPMLGTAAWVALPDSEPAKWAAVFHAARAWFNDYVTIPQRLARELTDERARWEEIIAERDHADYARFRAFCLQTATLIERRERRERDDSPTTRPNRPGAELGTAARAFWTDKDDQAPADSAGTVPPVGEVA